jgi:transketolase
MIHAAGSGHPGGSFSAADILAALYSDCLKFRPDEPDWLDRDRLVYSKGHGCPALYAAMAVAGYFPVDELIGLRKLDCRFQGHPDRRKIPALEASTGSLGQGLSIALGMALARRLSGQDYHVYCVIGDGETDEGQIWEAALYAGAHGVDHLIGITDYNKIQNDDYSENILPKRDLPEKWAACGWHPIEIDGHDISAIRGALEEARGVSGKPVMIVAHTVKGKGVSFMEDEPGWHGKAPNDEEFVRAMAELGEEVSV